MKCARTYFPILILLILLSLVGCEPGYDLKVENQTDQVLIVYFGPSRVGNVMRIGKIQPDEQIETLVYPHAGYYQLEAKNSQGEIIFSKEFDIRELVEELKWKVVIPTSFE